MSYEPGESVASDLGGYVNWYWNEYRNHWRLQNADDVPESERLSSEQFDELGGAFRTALRSLNAEPNLMAVLTRILEGKLEPDSYTRQDAVNVAKLFAMRGMVNDCIRINLAFEAVDELLDTAENRVASLLDLVAIRELSPRALAYLDRATRLYLWGFDPECVIMCRSVLEAALETALGNVIELDQHPPTLENLIRLAGEHRMLAGYEPVPGRRGWRAKKGTPLWRAERIRWAGNEVVHKVPAIMAKHPDNIETAETAVTELGELLSLLFP